MSNKFLHDPNSVLEYRWDWSGWLAAAETISSFTVTAPTGITITTPAASQALGVVTAWITGGTPPALYPIVCHITTSAGRQDDRTITLRAQNR